MPGRAKKAPNPPAVDKAASLVSTVYDEDKQPVEYLRHVVHYKGFLGSKSTHLPPVNPSFTYDTKLGKAFDFPKWLLSVMEVPLNQAIIQAEAEDGFRRMKALQRQPVNKYNKPLPTGDVITDKSYYPVTVKWFSPSLFGAIEVWADNNDGWFDDTLVTRINKGGLIGVLSMLQRKTGEMACHTFKKQKMKGEALRAKIIEYTRPLFEAYALLLKSVFPMQGETLLHPVDFYPNTSIDKKLVDDAYSGLNIFEDCFTNGRDVELLNGEMRKLGILSYNPVFHQVRENEKAKQQVEAVLRPTELTEPMLKLAVERLMSGVFSGVDKWEEVSPPVNGDERVIQTWYGNAACLMQLLIGSRSLGISLVNFVQPYDSASSMDVKESVKDETPLAHARHLVTVTQLSKETTATKKAFRDLAKKKQMSVVDVGEIVIEDKDFDKKVEKAQMEIDNRSVTKPFQFYFLEPQDYGFAGDNPSDRIKRWLEPDNPETFDTMFIVLRLMQMIREFAMQVFKQQPAYKKKDEDKMWHHGVVKYRGREFTQYYMNLKYQKEPVFEQTSRVLYNYAKNACTLAFKKVPGLDGKNTHTLRRLYVVYSYLTFGIDKMKEIAYARKVLDHSSYQVSVFYTSIQIKQSLGGKTDDYSIMSQRLAKLVQDMVGDLEKKMEKRLVALETGFAENGFVAKRRRTSEKRMRLVAEEREGKEKEVITKEREEGEISDDSDMEMNSDLLPFNTREGHVVFVPRLPKRTGFKDSKEALVNRALTKLQDLEAMGVEVKFVHLRYVGVSSNLVSEVWGTFKKWRKP